MKDDSCIISGFDGESGGENPFTVDFVAARPLDVSGSTCDVYECTIQRRRSFVKRLKAEYRNNPLYRAAFSKEFELGVSLSHPSLPRYVGFGGEYIVIDYVEGDTLAALIQRNDSRLEDKKFVRKLLRELIDVVGYLHNRNIVHCDIKPDNIIVSPYPERPAMLVDFDKAYSPWLDSSHGSAEKYGCEGCADGMIDFKGIGLIARKLGNKKLAKACGKSGVTVDLLKRSLGRGVALRAVTSGVAVAVAVAAAVVATLFINNGTINDGAETDKEASVVYDTAEVVDTSAFVPVREAPSERLTAPEKPAVDNVWVASLIAEKSAEINTYRQRLWKILDSDTVSVYDKHMAIYDYVGYSGSATNEILFTAINRYRTINEPDVQNAVRQNPAWIRLAGEEAEILNRINDWRTKLKQSECLSDHPALPPDTLPDALLPAQHR